MLVARERERLDVLVVIAHPIEHVSLFEVPHDDSGNDICAHLLARGQKRARFGNCDLADATIVALKVSVSV